MLFVCFVIDTLSNSIYLSNITQSPEIMKIVDYQTSQDHSNTEDSSQMKFVHPEQVDNDK